MTILAILGGYFGYFLNKILAESQLFYHFVIPWWWQTFWHIKIVFAELSGFDPHFTHSVFVYDFQINRNKVAERRESITRVENHDQAAIRNNRYGPLILESFLIVAFFFETFVIMFTLNFFEGSSPQKLSIFSEVDYWQ